MTERETMLQTALLTALADQSRPRSEAFLHARVHAALGVTFTFAEITAALGRVQKRGFATGLPNGDETIEWRITSEGRHHLIHE